MNDMYNQLELYWAGLKITIHIPNNTSLWLHHLMGI